MYPLNKNPKTIPRMLPITTSKGVCPRNSLNSSLIISIPSLFSILSTSVFKAFACYPACPLIPVASYRTIPMKTIDIANSIEVAPLRI